MYLYIAYITIYTAYITKTGNNVQNGNEETEKEAEKEPKTYENNNVQNEQKTDNNMQKEDPLSDMKSANNVPKNVMNVCSRTVKSSVIAPNKLLDKVKSKIKGA